MKNFATLPNQAITNRVRKYSQMNSEALFNKLVRSSVPKKDAKIVATIIERRFPTPFKLTSAK